jgi:hypothetical protein
MKLVFRIGICCCFVAMTGLWTGCTKQNVAVQTGDVTLTDTALWRSGLAKAESRDYDGAFADIQLAMQKNPMLKYELALAHLRFLNKSYRDAVKQYEALIASGRLNRRQQDELKAEVKRINDASGEVTGRSLAGQWIRATVAVVEAEEAIEREDYGVAYTRYDKAYQYNQDYELLLESALAASRAKQWEWAHQKLKEYVAVGGDDISRDMQYRVYAEIDRIMSMLKGEKVVTEKSLADEIYAERNGVEEADGLPPSMLTAAASESADTDPSAKLNAAGDSDVEETEAAPVATAVSGSEVSVDEKGEKQADESSAPDLAEQKRLEKEAARIRAEEARERQLALKAEREEKRKAAQEARRQKALEQKAVLAKKKEDARKRKEEARARREEEKQKQLLEKKLAAEAKAKEREIARQEKLAQLEAERARKAELAAARLAEKERSQEEAQAAAEAERERAAADREAAEQAHKAALEKRAQLKEERRLAALAKAEEKKRVREETRQRKAEEQAHKVEERRLEKEARLAQAAERKREKEEAKRIAAEERRAEIEEKQAEKQRVKLEKELAAQQAETPAKPVAMEKAGMPDGDTKKVAMSVKQPSAREEKSADSPALKQMGKMASAKSASDAKPETSFEDLLFYARSRSATVRYRAVRDLIPLLNERSRAALEDRVVQDRNIHVRFLAIEGLVQRHSVASLPILEHALVTAATSQERATLKNAISQIRLGRK